MSNSNTKRAPAEPPPSRAKPIVRARKGVERVSLRTLREGMGRSQAEVADAIGTDQGEVSRIERRGDLRLSTLRRYAEAVGARLEVAFVFDDAGRRRAVIEDPDTNAEVVR
jgi:transcriptional regulator with XRE-family HTH domain